MRSVKAARKPRGSAPTQASRRGQGAKRAPVERYELGKKKKGSRGAGFSRVRGAVLGSVRRPILLLTGLLLAASFVTAIVAGGYISKTYKAAGRGIDTLIADAGFGISSVHLAGNSRTEPSAILTALGFEPGEPIFGADIQAARLRLLALPWVADAQVRRQFPDSIAVSIVEKLPFALWQTPDGVFVVERPGRIITKVDASRFPHLPLFLGEGAPQSGAELVDAIATHRAVSARVKAMQRVSDRRWNLLLDDGVLVELPESGWQKQLDELEHLIVDKAILERDIGEIDLRSPDNYFFLPKNGVRQQATRGNQT